MRYIILISLILTGCAQPRPHYQNIELTTAMLDWVAPGGCQFDDTKIQYRCADEDQGGINDRVPAVWEKMIDHLAANNPYYDKRNLAVMVVHDLYACTEPAPGAPTMYCKTKLTGPFMGKVLEEKKGHFAGKVDGKYKYAHTP